MRRPFHSPSRPRNTSCRKACHWRREGPQVGLRRPASRVEVVEYGFRAGRRDREDRAATVAVAWTGAAGLRSAIKPALDVDEARTRVCAIPRVNFEAVEHAVRGPRVRSLRRDSGRLWALRRAASAAARG